MTKLFFETDGSELQNQAANQAIVNYLKSDCQIEVTKGDEWRDKIEEDPDFLAFDDDCLVFSNEIAAKNLESFLRDANITAFIVE